MTELKGLVRISKQPRFDIPDKDPMEYCLVWKLLLGQLVKIAYPPRKQNRETHQAWKYVQTM